MIEKKAYRDTSNSKECEEVLSEIHKDLVQRKHAQVAKIEFARQAKIREAQARYLPQSFYLSISIHPYVTE